MKVPEERLMRLRLGTSGLTGRQAKLKQYLSHSKLSRLIRDLNSQPARRRTKALWTHLEQDESFREVVDTMLKEMGYLNERGEFDAKGF